MGQSHSNNDFNPFSPVKKRSAIHLEQENWVLLEKPDVDVEEMGSFGIYRNIVTGEVARRYQLNLESKKSLESYVEEFDYWRSQVRWNVLESKYIVFEDKGFGFSQLCSSYHPVKIFVQNPVVTLAEIKDIPVPQGLYVLLSTLVGFQHLFDIFGYFSLTQSMITISEHGIIKVWLHPNLSSNRPLLTGLNNISLSDLECPDRFIRELIEMIENNIDYGDGNITFSDYINKKHENKRNLDFVHCKKYLLNFAQELQVDIPDSLSTILELLFQKSHQTSISQQGLSQTDGPVLYGKNYENKYILGDDQQNGQDQKFIVLQNLQSPSENSFFPQRSPSDQFGSFFPQDFSIPRVRNSTEESCQNQDKIILSRNYSYNNHNSIPYDPNPPFQSHNHKNSFTVQKQHINNLIENNYTLQVQHETNDKQSTIREQIEQDSFLTSNRNGRFQKDSKRRNSYLDKQMRNTPSHRNTFSSKSDSRIKIKTIENSPSKKEKFKEQSGKKIIPSQSQKSVVKASQKSIQFHTLHQVMQLDAEIAQDLQKMYKGTEQ